MTPVITSSEHEIALMQKILIVDDQPTIRRLLSITLGRDYDVVEASDGSSALDAIRIHKPRAVLLDIMMPGEIDGLHVLKIIKADPNLNGTFVAMLTARGQADDFRLGQEIGADAYFIKPFSPLQIVTWLKAKLV